jgi:alkanesulfonate monooxygenase SsuD/methylene tetrahydromethanopterin reductase-like flavin-dependent oxidoreductase (luciferase family)
MDFQFGVMFDFRNPEPWRQPWDKRYAELLKVLDWIDDTPAFQGVAVSEHHFVDDGYAPAVMATAAAMAARTDRVGIATTVLLLPLHHPLRIAEDALVVDAISGGRFRLGIGGGYVPHEFESFGVATKDRPVRMEEGVKILRAAFAGERFSFQGSQWSFGELKVSPGPVRDGGPPIWVGASVPKAIDRAARLGDGFFASLDEQIPLFYDARKKRGLPVDGHLTCRTVTAVIAEDPERAMAEVGEYVTYLINAYIEWGFIKLPPFKSIEPIVEMGVFPFVDAAGAISMFEEIGNLGVDEIHVMSALPGEPVAGAQARLEYLATEVIPKFSGPQVP